jgi:hypothetical protein
MSQGDWNGGAYGPPPHAMVPAAPMQAGVRQAAATGPRIELKLTTTKKVAAIACALIAPCTFGTTGLIILWMLYIWPTAVDAEGIQPRWGQKRLWRDLQEIRHVRMLG